MLSYTLVSLDKKEVDNAVIELAKRHLDKAIGGVSIEYFSVAENGKHFVQFTGAVVSFTGKVKT